jgi:hypothetical protein
MDIVVNREMPLMRTTSVRHLHECAHCARGRRLVRRKSIVALTFVGI